MFVGHVVTPTRTVLNFMIALFLGNECYFLTDQHAGTTGLGMCLPERDNWLKLRLQRSKDIRKSIVSK